MLAKHCTVVHVSTRVLKSLVQILNSLVSLKFMSFFKIFSEDQQQQINLQILFSVNLKKFLK